MYKITFAQNQMDIAKALDLFSKVFGPSYFESKIEFEIAQRFDETMDKNNFFLALDSRGSIAGVARAVTRTLRLFSHQFRVGGIVSTAVHPEHRHKGLFNLLTERMLSEMIERKMDLCLVFARKGIDHFYVKYGFWGVPVEKRIEILDPPLINDRSLKFREASCGDIQFLTEAHQEIYGKLNVYLERPSYVWMIKLKSPAFQRNFKVYICSKRGGRAPIGYVISQVGGGIHEVAALSSDADLYKKILFSSFSPVYESAKTALCLAEQHPALMLLKGESSAVYIRHPNHGGHLLKILDSLDNRNSKLVKLALSQITQRGALIKRNLSHIQPFIKSRALTAGLFGYEILETKSVLTIENNSKWNCLKPVDFIFSPYDQF